MKRIWAVMVVIALLAAGKFGYEYFYFDTHDRVAPTPISSANTSTSASPTPTPTETLPPVPPTAVEVQQKLIDLGIPAGSADGKWGPRTRQGFCIWRELTGRDINRNYLSADEQLALIDTKVLALPADSVVGLNINKTCQSVNWLKSADRSNYVISTVSTGAPGMETEVGSFKVTWRVNRWYESISIPDGWMYRPMFFNKGQAVHGSEFDKYVWWYPASHGCVRMLHSFIDELWKSDFGVGSNVRVYGTWNAFTVDPK